MSITTKPELLIHNKAKNLKGEWIYGHYAYSVIDDKHYIVEVDFMKQGKLCPENIQEIDEETLCIGTKVLDTDLREIYTDDKVGEDTYICFRPESAFLTTNNDKKYPIYFNKSYTIKGNKHDK